MELQRRDKRRSSKERCYKRVCKIVKWVPATGNTHPSGLLEVVECDIGRHVIARYKTNDGWEVRPSMFGQESFIGDELQFLWAPSASFVQWVEVRDNELPRRRYFISDKRDGEPQKYVGKHKTVGVGHVMRDPNTDKFTLFQGNNSIVENFEVLCYRL